MLRALRTFFGGVALLALGVIIVLIPTILVMIALGNLHDVHPSIPALGLWSIINGEVVLGVAGAVWNGSAFASSRKASE
jgi:hypothetical protein